MIKDGRPYSCENGFIDNELVTDLPDEIVRAVEEWIRLYIQPRKTPFRGCTSYGLKHILQGDIGIYLTNNQFKDAMMRCGYNPVNPNDLNWRYRISARSLALSSKHDEKRAVSIPRDQLLEIWKTA